MAKENQKAVDTQAGGKKTIWQVIKFTLVGMLASVVSFGLLNILIRVPQVANLFATPFKWFVFDYPVEKNAAGQIVLGGLGNFIAFNTSNVLAQVVAFFINRDKTFKSSANVAVTLPIYLVFTVALLSFSAWLSPQISALLLGKVIFGTEIATGLAANIANGVVSAVQFFAYFPVSKILFRKPKEQ